MSGEFPTLADVVTATLNECGIDDADMVETPDIIRAWREARTVRTVEDLDHVPARAIVRSEAGTIACRFDGRNGVVFGDDRPFPWHKLALPALLLWHPDWSQS
jgi:hypothetical protein